MQKHVSPNKINRKLEALRLPKTFIKVSKNCKTSIAMDDLATAKQNISANQKPPIFLKHYLRLSKKEATYEATYYEHSKNTYISNFVPSKRH